MGECCFQEDDDWLMDTSPPLEMQEDYEKEEIIISNTMVGTNAKRRHNGQICETPGKYMRSRFYA